MIGQKREENRERREMNDQMISLDWSMRGEDRQLHCGAAPRVSALNQTGEPVLTTYQLGHIL